MLLNVAISVARLFSTKEGISVIDSGTVEKINLSNAGVVTLPNASISTADLVTMKGGTSITDSLAVKMINISITAAGVLRTKRGLLIKDGSSNEQTKFNNTG